MRIMYVIVLSLCIFDLSARADENTISSESIEVNQLESENIEFSIKNEKYLISPVDIDTEAVRRNLSFEDYKSFLSTRSEFLSLTAKAMQSIKFGFGIGTVVKNHFEYKSY